MTKVFTDNNLQSLKEDALSRKPATMWAKETLALIARLEAAEACIDTERCSCSQYCDAHSDLHKKWELTAGK